MPKDEFLYLFCSKADKELILRSARLGHASVAARCGNREVPQSVGGRKGGEVGE